MTVTPYSLIAVSALILITVTVLCIVFYVKLSRGFAEVKMIRDMLNQFLALPQTDTTIPSWFDKTFPTEDMKPSISIPEGWDQWSDAVESGEPSADVARPYPHA